MFFLRHGSYLDFDAFGEVTETSSGLDLVPEHVCVGSERVE